ncbi:GAF domain-containing sensor histidine kinase [Nitrosopumilus sp. S6]
MEAPLLINEEERIQSLHALKILDTPPEEKFDRITKIAQIIFDVPIALVSLVDVNRQWFKSCAGLSARETPRSMSFCAHAIHKDEILVVEDATKDERFSDNLLVTSEPYIKFYAGKPLFGVDHHVLGTLCIIDRQPRKLSKGDKNILNDLAQWVENEFKTITLTQQLKENTNKLMDAETKLRKQNIDLEKEIKQKTEQLLKTEKMSALGTMASRLAHDLKNPLSIIKTYSEILSKQLENDMDDQMKQRCGLLKNSITDVNRIIEDTLDFVRTSQINPSYNSVMEILKNSLHNLSVPETVKITLPENDSKINCDARKMEAVFTNILLNSIQAMNDSGNIIIQIDDDSSKLRIKIEDSGSGIPDEIMPKIFEPLFTSKSSGTGLGLGICKSIIEQHGGTISVTNNPTTFTIELPKTDN